METLLVVDGAFGVLDRILETRPLERLQSERTRVTGPTRWIGVSRTRPRMFERNTEFETPFGDICFYHLSNETSMLMGSLSTAGELVT